MATIALPSRTPWKEFLDSFDWRQGEHTTLLGHTGSGKTTLARHILPKQPYSIIVATKNRDKNIEVFKKDGYRVSRTPNFFSTASGGVLYPRMVLWPKTKDIGDIESQREDIYKCLAYVWKSKGWCLFFDEVRYLTEVLRLDTYVSQLWREGRSSAISILAGTQRPAWIPREAYSEATHLFIWRSTNKYDLKRLEDASNVDTQFLAPIIRSLPLHDVLYINTRSGEMVRTRVS